MTWCKDCICVGFKRDYFTVKVSAPLPINQSIKLYSLSYMIHVKHEASVNTNKHIIFVMAACTHTHTHRHVHRHTHTSFTLKGNCGKIMRLFSITF